MSEKIVQLNEEVIKGQLKELVRCLLYTSRWSLLFLFPAHIFSFLLTSFPLTRYTVYPTHADKAITNTTNSLQTAPEIPLNFLSLSLIHI